MNQKDNKDKAFNLYCDGYSLYEISKNFFNGYPTRQTIAKWIKKDGWEERRKEVLTRMKQKVNERLADNLADIKERQIKISQAVQGKFIERMKNDENLKITPMDAERFMRHELLLKGEATEIVENRGQEFWKLAKEALEEIKNDELKKSDNNGGNETANVEPVSDSKEALQE